ncbi:Vps52-domain-containing protein [Laetiporus sulphureus 93-53]|uniref:Vps52-domain-containing protein n=1 Tax=Laetiporus sulphureus 93-53 TaxID=1314785 RepID=A0A165I3X5_9APHY|nr:Vps52-domain-containing protein [Laetiporus sulphureus 93-53]KZT12563.1 Vps52-domain-containing protein [Laetiporus sulphureus 93-53]
MMPEDGGRAQEFVDLHDQVQASVNLLDSLEQFLSTFQKDLSAVSGQISTLQDRSRDIENRLKSRKRIEKPLSSLLVDLCIPPQVTTLILDTPVGEPWISAIGEFERKLDALKIRSRVKAARDLAEVAEGLRIVAATKLRTFFLSLLQPIRASMTTNMQVLQTSVFMKYRPLFVFLQRHATSVASEVQRAYVGSARTYYETGFRRYIRSLGYLKARIVEKTEPIASNVGEDPEDMETQVDRLAYARIDGPGVALTYLAEDKTYQEPIEALLRSMLLVLMDNATAEFTFVNNFFAQEHGHTMHSKQSSVSLQSPTSLLFPMAGDYDDTLSNADSELNLTPLQRVNSIASVMSAAAGDSSTKEDEAALHAIWKQIMDPVLEYCQTFINSILEPAPPVIPLLTMIRMTEDVMKEVQKRNCSPLETFIFTIRLQMWPVFQKLMAEHIDSVKKLADGATSGYFRRGVVTTDTAVSNICRRYAVTFNSFIALTEQPEETMIFSNLLRLRQELTKLIATHTDKMGDAVRKASSQSTLYEVLLQGLSRGPTSHPKAQSEIAYWRGREEEARRRVASTHRQR